MRTSLKWVASLAGLSLMVGTALAQNYGYSEQTPQSGSMGSQGWSSQQGSQASQSQSQQQQRRFVDAKRLLGQDVNDSQGQTVGHIKDILFNLQNGETFAVIGIGNNQNALVPTQELKATGWGPNLQVSVNTSRQNLQNGPLVQNNQWLQALSNPSFIQRVYSHYGTQPPSSMGGSSSTGGSSSGSSQYQSGSSEQY